MDVLTERRERLLRFIVDEYVRPRPAAGPAARPSYLPGVPAPRAPRPRLRWLQLVSLHDFVALLVLVLQETLVVQHTLTLDRPLSQDELSDVALRLNSLYAGRTVDEIRSRQIEHLSLEAEVVRSALALMQSQAAESFGEAYLEGLREMLSEPEFAQGDRILALMELLGRAN